ncbi:MAG: hypothetical protein ACLQPD_20480 [Desulfomonilaceae bacterium]
MLKSYEAVYEDGRLEWVRERPAAKRMKVIVTVLEDDTDARSVVSTKELLERTKGCVRPGKSLEEIDADIRQMRR